MPQEELESFGSWKIWSTRKIDMEKIFCAAILSLFFIIITYAVSKAMKGE